MKVIKIIIFTLLAFNLNSFAQFKVPQPKPELFVNDYTNTLNANEKNILLDKIKQFEKASSIQIAIVILNDFQGYEIEDITLAIGREWGVGQKGLNNGILYLVSPENRKGRIEVGPGVQGDITDAFANQIQESVKRYYRNGDYFTGIEDIVDNLIGKLQPISWEERERYKAEKQKQTEATVAAIGDTIINVLLGIGVLGGFIFAFIFIRRKIKAKQKELQDLKSYYNNKQRLLRDKKNNFLPYKKEVFSAGAAIIVIDRHLSLPEAKTKKQIQYMISQCDDITHSTVLRRANDDINEYKDFNFFKNKIKEEVDSIKFIDFEGIERKLSKEQNEFENKRDVYFKLFGNKVMNQDDVNAENESAKNKIFECKTKLENTLKDDDYIKENRSEINSLIQNLKFFVDTFKSSGNYYSVYLSTMTNELNKIYNAKKYFIADLSSVTEEKIKKPFVTDVTRESMNSHFNDAKVIYNNWFDKKDDIVVDLQTFNKLIAIQTIIQEVYEVDYSAYKKEQDRLQKIKEEEERKKREEEERERRKKREKREREEEEERRRNSYYTSNDSFSSFGSSSSSSDSGSFGGGSFDGGGASSSW